MARNITFYIKWKTTKIPESNKNYKLVDPELILTKSDFYEHGEILVPWVTL